MKARLRILTLAGLVACGLTAFAQTTSSDANANPSSAEAAPAAEPDSASESVAGGAVIPLIVMDDVPLTDAIKNLARQAGLNYMLDPKVTYGQPGPDGRAVPQPMVSIRWENVTAEQALTALLNNHSLQLVEDPKSKISRVTVKDPAAPDPLVTKVVQLKYAAPTNIIAAIQNTFTDKRSKVVADVRTSQLVLLATEKEMSEIGALIDRLDTQTRQVLIEARLLETVVNPSTMKGIDWSGTLEKQIVSFGNVNRFSPATTMNPTGGKFFNPSTFFLDADGVSLALSFLNKYTDSKVISAPRTVTLDNEPAHIEVGTQYPIVNVTASTANTSGGSQVSYSNLTVRLDVTPRISANNFVNLKVTPHAMRLAEVKTIKAGSGGGSGVALFDVPVFNTRTIETTVMIPSGNTLVMGGLMEDNINDMSTKVPVLGDIPGLGYLFRKDDKDRKKSNLTVFITPTIVGEEDFQPTKTGFLQTPVPTQDSFGADWSAWNSGKPGNPFEKSESAGTAGGSAAENAGGAGADEEFSPLPASK